LRIWADLASRRPTNDCAASNYVSAEETRMSPDRQEVTKLLQQWRGGNQEALDQLMPVVYDELRRVAKRCLYAERPGHTLRATALVHEAYIRLLDADISWQDRAHFYAVAARVLRRILVEYARAHGRQKRGGGEEAIPLDEAMVVGPQAASTVLDLDEALERLAAVDARKSEIIQLLFFGGLTYEETAAALDISPATVHRELKLAKAWLHRELAESQT
jgi:RNA polymerase sigma-70 factor, ECF subfamily